MDKLKVAVVGYGSVAWLQHFPVIARSPKLELVAVCGPNLERAQEAASRWAAPATFPDVQALVNGLAFDAAVIASPNAFHYDQAITLLEAGRHVYVEKPMSTTNTQAWSMVEAARRNHVKLTIGCHQRFYLQHRWARDLIEQGVIGEVRFARTSLHESWRLYQENVAMSDFRLKPELSLAGTLFDQGSHRVDLLLWLMGSQPKSLVGIARNVSSPELGESIDDLALITFECNSGAYGMVTADKFSPVVSNITEIYGTEGIMFATSEVLNPFQSVPLAVYTSRDYDWESLPDILREYRWPIDFWVSDLIQKPLPKRWISVTPPRVQPFDLIMDDFASSIIDGREPLVSGEDGANTMEVLSGVFESMRVGGWVNLPLQHEVFPPAVHRSDP
jgi:predicted dehydrogenase